MGVVFWDVDTNWTIIWALVELDILVENITTPETNIWLAGKSPSYFQ